MTLNNGERQVAPTVDGIRRDHVARYEFAARMIPAESRVIDFACGIGYGTKMLAEVGHVVNGYDVNADAIAYARNHYQHPRACFLTEDGRAPVDLSEAAAAVCFETIEHIKDPLPLLKALHKAAPLLLASVPNEVVMPYGDGYAFHCRHYTPAQFEGLLQRAGWKVTEWWGQEGPESEVERDVMGRTVIAVCTRMDGTELQPETVEETAGLGRGGQALDRLLRIPGVRSVLDVGSGFGVHAQIMRSFGKTVTTVSLEAPADHVCDFVEWGGQPESFDAVWACHVLEHQLDVGAFLAACRRQLRDGGILAITVPPAKHFIVGGHLTLWNAGLLLYNLILAGFDCRNAMVGTYGYNISVIVAKGDVDLPPLYFDEGDIDRLAAFFPVPLTQGFDGRLPDIGWEA